MKVQSRPEVPSRLGVGPVSRNTVDATIRMAYRHQRTVMLVASRGQIECDEMGGGYVGRWTTESFTRYVRDRDPAGLVKICRDHGGPWQHPEDSARDHSEQHVLDRSLVSLRADIRSGMDLLHIDTSREGQEGADFERALKRLVMLYHECQEYAHSRNEMLGFEIGLERQSDEADDPREFSAKLERIVDALASACLRWPTFVVVQTGTRVEGTKNRGALVTHREAVVEAVGELARICWENGMALKAHNVDYLPADAITGLFRSGTDAINVAPEFGVLETLSLLELLNELKLPRERDNFLQLAYESGAWRKWFDDGGTDLDRSVVAGHYVFATDEFLEIKRQANQACRRSLGFTVDGVLGKALDRALERYARLAWM